MQSVENSSESAVLQMETWEVKSCFLRFQEVEEEWLLRWSRVDERWGM